MLSVVLSTKGKGMFNKQVKGIPQELAEEALEAYWGKTHPVDPVVVARHAGAEIFMANTAENVAAVVRKNPGKSLEIYVSRDLPRDKQRYYIAKMLGYFICRTINDAAEWEHVENMTPDSNHEEYEANLFALHLLVPSKRLRRIRKATPFKISYVFNVPLEQAQARLLEP